MKNSQKTMAMWAILIVVGILLIQMWQAQQQSTIRDFNYSKFVKAVDANEVKSVTFRDGEILGEIKVK